jgi:Sulfotransferase domain
MDRRAQPTFVIIGAQKCATRWLRINLGRHPQVFTSPSEMHFWNNGHRVSKLGVEWYQDQFEGWNGEEIVGEATPGYMIWRHHPGKVAFRMKVHQPDTKVIAILRNPIDRAQSALLHHIRRQRIPASARLVDVIRERGAPESDWFCLVSGGWYAASLEPYINAFGDQLLVLFHDEVATDPARPFQAALRHIGADPEFTPEDLTRVVFSNQKSRAGRKNQLTIEDRFEMWDYFREDVARLEELLDVDLSRWTPQVTEPVADESHA